jgi:hypothetical protein
MTDEPTTPISVDGRCLCGGIAYHVEGEAFGIIYCHCQRCRKQTGATLVGFVILKDGRIRWKSGRDLLRRYKSEITTRAFCGRCGSAVPGVKEDGAINGVTAGSIIDMNPPLDIWHLFTSTKCPWYEIPAHEKQYESVGEGFEDQDPSLPNLVRHTEKDRITGSCLCGIVTYGAQNPAYMMNCHCTRCRFSRAAPFATNLFAEEKDFEWLSGKDKVKSFRVPEAERFTASFCSDCGSRIPVVGSEYAVMPAGGLDSDPRLKPSGHIFVGSKARWFEIDDNLTKWQEQMIRRTDR